MESETYTCKTVTAGFFGMLGLAKRAGKTVHGTDVICEQMRAKKKPVLIFVSQTASEGTKRRLRTKTHFYNIPLCEISASTQELGHILSGGGLTAAVAITDEGLAQRLLSECK